MNFQDQIPNFLHGVARLTAVPMVLAAVWLANTPLAAAQTTEEMIKAGEKVFRTVAEIGCASCHGDYAEGDKGIGPYNRGVGEEKIRAAINSIEAMERPQLGTVQLKLIISLSPNTRIQFQGLTRRR